MTTTQPGLSHTDRNMLGAYGRGEHIPDIALRLGITADEVGIRLTNLCGMRREHAYYLAVATRSGPLTNPVVFQPPDTEQPTTTSATPKDRPTGTCPFCGATNLRLHRGLIPYHFEQRIRAGEHGAETYTSGTACDGERHKPEPDTA